MGMLQNIKWKAKADEKFNWQAATIARGYTLEELESVRAEKAKKRGGFEKKIFLIDVTEKIN